MFLLGKLLFCQDKVSVEKVERVLSLPLRIAKLEPIKLQTDLSATMYRIQYRVFVNNKQVFKTNVPLLR